MRLYLKSFPPTYPLVKIIESALSHSVAIKLQTGLSFIRLFQFTE